MNIAIDGNEANVESGVGINTYAKNVLIGLYELNKDHKHSYTIFLKHKAHSDMPKENDFWKYKVLKSRKMWILTALTPHLLANSKAFDLFFTPSHYVPPVVPIKRVCAIMDLGYLENSDQFRAFDYWQLRLWSAYSILASRLILSISGQTASDIVRHYGFAKKKLKITHLGYDNQAFNMNISSMEVVRVKKKYDIVSDYLLFLSTLKPSKNIVGLLVAWAKIADKYPKINLVIAGKKGWLFESVFEKVVELKLQKRVIFTDFVSEEDKAGLVKGAKAFVLPSYWEGFGLDVLSSMACGVPVVISNIGSLPEVGGNAALYIDPYDTDSIATALEKVLNLSKDEYNKLVLKGLSQANKFSWQKTAQQTLEALESVARK